MHLFPLFQTQKYKNNCSIFYRNKKYKNLQIKSPF